MPRGTNEATVQAILAALSTGPSESSEAPWDEMLKSLARTEGMLSAPSPYPEMNIRIRFTANGEEIEEAQAHHVEVIAPDRLRIRDSSSLFDNFKLYYGDEVIVRQIGPEDFELVSVVQPSAMQHFSFIGSGDPKVLTAPLHALGGEWECDAGGLCLVHIPRGKVEAFNQQTGLDLKLREEVFSGYSA